jgi:copper chaperone CopZ
MENKKENSSCCPPPSKDGGKKGFLQGVFYGIAPHGFCIAFVILSVTGTALGASFMKKIMMFNYFFHILIALSVIFATVSAALYLKRNNKFSLGGAKRSWKYLSILYGATVGVNLLFFLVLFPYAANFKFASAQRDVSPLDRKMEIRVDIPCSGHASLISGELKKIDGVKSVKFKFPDFFEISYDESKVTEDRIFSLEVFKTYEAELKNNPWKN